MTGAWHVSEHDGEASARYGGGNRSWLAVTGNNAPLHRRHGALSYRRARAFDIIEERTRTRVDTESLGRAIQCASKPGVNPAEIVTPRACGAK